MRRLALAIALCIIATTTPAFAADPAPQATQASAESIDRLLDVMDMENMMAGMMAQMSAAQQKMVADAFGKDLSDKDKARMQDVVAETNAIVQKAMAWPALEPVIRKVYAQVFTAQEVHAMTAFYDSAEGASILRKTPQAAALTMQELQPVMAAAMEEVKATLEARATPGN